MENFNVKFKKVMENEITISAENREDLFRKIFELYASGLGYYKICEYLNNNNIPPRSIYKKQKDGIYRFAAPIFFRYFAISQLPLRAISA